MNAPLFMAGGDRVLTTDLAFNGSLWENLLMPTHGAVEKIPCPLGITLKFFDGHSCEWRMLRGGRKKYRVNLIVFIEQINV